MCVYIYTHMYVYMCVHICIYLYICVYIYLNVFISATLYWKSSKDHFATVVGDQRYTEGAGGAQRFSCGHALSCHRLDARGGEA